MSDSIYENPAFADRYRKSSGNIAGAQRRSKFDFLNSAVDAFIEQGPVRSILEAGCGSGAVLHQLDKHIGSQDIDFYGADLAQSQIVHAAGDFRDNPRFAFAVANGAALPFASESMDIAYEYSALSWSMEPMEFVGELIRVSRGLVVFSAVLSKDRKTFHQCIFETFRKTEDGYQPLGDISAFGVPQFFGVAFFPTAQEGIYRYPVWAQKVRLPTRAELDELLEDERIEVLKINEDQEEAMELVRDGDDNGPLREGDEMDLTHHEIVEVAAIRRAA